MNYPRAIVTELKAHKLAGLPFPVAWAQAMETVGEPPTDERGPWAYVLRWMRREFRKAYEGTGKPVRLESSESAEPPIRPNTRVTPSEGVSGPYSPLKRDDCEVRPSVVRCRWGDGCDRDGGHGKFGHFCADHVAVIAKAMERPLQLTPQAEQTEQYCERRRANQQAGGTIYGFAGVDPEARRRGAENGAPGKRKAKAA